MKNYILIMFTLLFSYSSFSCDKSFVISKVKRILASEVQGEDPQNFRLENVFIGVTKKIDGYTATYTLQVKGDSVDFDTQRELHVGTVSFSEKCIRTTKPSLKTLSPVTIMN